MLKKHCFILHVAFVNAQNAPDVTFSNAKSFLGSKKLIQPVVFFMILTGPRGNLGFSWPPTYMSRLAGGPPRKREFQLVAYM